MRGLGGCITRPCGTSLAPHQHQHRRALGPTRQPHPANPPPHQHQQRRVLGPTPQPHPALPPGGLPSQGLGKTVTALSLVLKTLGQLPSPPPGATVQWLSNRSGRKVGFYTTPCRGGGGGGTAADAAGAALDSPGGGGGGAGLALGGAGRRRPVRVPAAKCAALYTPPKGPHQRRQPRTQRQIPEEEEEEEQQQREGGPGPRTRSRLPSSTTPASQEGGCVWGAAAKIQTRGSQVWSPEGWA
jgi:hypothetical protein